MWMLREKWWLIGDVVADKDVEAHVEDVVAHWYRSRLLRRWSLVRIRHLSQWKKTLRTGRVIVYRYTVKISGSRKGNFYP